MATMWNKCLSVEKANGLVSESFFGKRQIKQMALDY